MKSSPHRPLILKRRKLSLPHTEAFNGLVRNESDGQTAGSSKQEQARTDEPDMNRKEPAVRDISTRIRIIDHPTLSDAQVVAVPTNADIQSILEALAAKGKESGSNGPNKFILISNGSRSSSMKSRAFQDLFKSEDEHITTNSTAQEEATCVGQSSGTVEKPTFLTSESLSAGGREQEGNSNGEAPSCGLDNSLTNIQWLGKMSSNELSPCSGKKEAEKENQTPKQRTVKCEEGLAPSSSATSWQEPFSERPPYSYMAMIQFAINSTEKKCMMLKDIYTWIEDHFPYFKHVAKPGWKNSIRHNLSLHEMFVRETSANGKISFWTIHPEANRYLTLDQVFKQQKRHSLDLQKDMGGSRGSKSEPQTTRWRMKPLLPRVNSYLVPIQFPVSQSLLLPSSSKAPLPITKSASENMKSSSRRVRIAPKVLPSSEEPVLFPAAVSVKEEACCDEGPCPLAAHQCAKEDACQISRASLPAALCIKEERGGFHPNPLSPSFLPALPVKEEPALNLGFPAAPVKQKRPLMALMSPPQSTLDLLVIQTQEEQAVGRRSRRKQPLARPCSEEPVLLLPGGGGCPDSLTLRPDLPVEREIPPQGNVSNFRCFQEEGSPFRTPMKEMSCKLPNSSTPGRKTSVAAPTALGSADPWGLAPFVKETSNPDFSPVRNPPLPLLSLQENWDLLGFSSPPLSVTPLCDSPQLPLLNAEANDMVSGPLTSSPAPSEQPSPERWASVLPEKHSLLEGLVLDTMNDSLSKILLDVSFPGPEDDLSTDFSWSQLIPELK